MHRDPRRSENPKCRQVVAEIVAALEGKSVEQVLNCMLFTSEPSLGDYQCVDDLAIREDGVNKTAKAAR